MIDVMFYEVFEEEEKSLKALMPDSLNVQYTKHTTQNYPQEYPEAKIICIRTQSKLPQELTENVKGILSRSAGYDHLVIDKKSTAVDIPLGYLHHYCSRSVAEQAIGLMFALLRQLPHQQRKMQHFSRDHLTGEEVHNNKALVLGVGNIGSEIVNMAKALGMEVKGFDVNPTREDIEYVDLQQGLNWANIIFCALSLNKETQHVLNEKCLSKLTHKPYVINIARGEMTPTQDIVNLIQNNKLSGLALDVYENEAMFADHLREEKHLLSHEQALMDLTQTHNVVLTPHNAFNTQQALEHKSQQTVESIIHFFEHQKFPYQI